MSKEFFNKLDQDAWTRNIESFQWWKNFYFRVSNKEIRDACISNMKRIQEKYPQYIKLLEIPS